VNAGRLPRLFWDLIAHLQMKKHPMYHGYHFLEAGKKSCGMQMCTSTEY
jgi:hypothetical protein